MTPYALIPQSQDVIQIQSEFSNNGGSSNFFLARPLSSGDRYYLQLFEIIPPTLATPIENAYHLYRFNVNRPDTTDAMTITFQPPHSLIGLMRFIDCAATGVQFFVFGSVSTISQFTINLQVSASSFVLECRVVFVNGADSRIGLTPYAYPELIEAAVSFTDPNNSSERVHASIMPPAFPFQLPPSSFTATIKSARYYDDNTIMWAVNIYKPELRVFAAEDLFLFSTASTPTMESIYIGLFQHPHYQDIVQ